MSSEKHDKGGLSIGGMDSMIPKMNNGSSTREARDSAKKDNDQRFSTLHAENSGNYVAQHITGWGFHCHCNEFEALLHFGNGIR